MTIKVLVNGAHGKMGLCVVAAVAQDPALTLVASCDRQDDLAACIASSQADVVVDFTSAECAFQNTRVILAAKARPIIGSSGLTAVQVEQLQRMAKEHQLGGVIAPNFSIGAIMMMQFAKQAAAQFANVEIIEYHHNHKKDAPSGTATKTAEMLADVINKTERYDATEIENAQGARGGRVNDIPVHSVRLPGLLAHQAVIFGSLGETLTIKHDSINRECFMPGVCLACKKSMDLDELVYGLEHIL